MQLPRATRLVVRIAGERVHLWRAVDQDGFVLVAAGVTDMRQRVRQPSPHFSKGVGASGSLI